ELEEQAEEQQAELEEQAEEQQVEGQMDVDVEEEARADAELAASHAADPMMEGVETGGSSSGGTIRSWREVGWLGVVHRTSVNSALGAFCRFYYPSMVTLPNGDQERYRLDGEGDYDKEKMAKRVFQKAATKVVRDSFCNACIQAIVNFHKRVKNINIKKTLEVKKMHLEAEELIQKEAKYKEQVIQRHGQDYDWRAAHQTLKPYTMPVVGYTMAVGGWVMVPWSTIVFQGRKGQSKELSQRLGSNVLEFRPPQLFPQVTSNYFVSTPSTQGPPLGDDQGSQPPPNWIVPSGQAPFPLPRWRCHPGVSASTMDVSYPRTALWRFFSG
ncbi:hypothetical protein U9M48_035477, partial [Paspalum notatum var. saurae]